VAFLIVNHVVKCWGKLNGLSTPGRVVGKITNNGGKVNK
jgi:hypothetical protein